MIRSRPSVRARRFGRAVSLALCGVLGLGATGFAQTIELLPSPSKVRDALARPSLHATFDARDMDVRPAAVVENRLEPRAAPKAAGSQPRLRPPASGHRGSRARRVTGAVIGGMAGFWLGGALGAALEGDSCNCDDPGMMGFVVGAPVGATIGAVVGAMLGGK